MPGKSPTLILAPNDHLNLYKTTVKTGVPDYVYVASSVSKEIDFTDTKLWLPQ